jgi:hypothetical protein
MKKILFILICFFFNSILFSQQTFQWAKTHSGPGVEDVFGVATDATGNLLIASMFTGTLDIDPGPGTFTVNTNGIEDIAISKVDPDGNLIWAKTIGSTGLEWVDGITLDISGNVFIIGSFSNTMDLDPGPGTFTLSSLNASRFVLKLDPSGNFIWAKNFGGPTSFGLYGITTDATGDVYVTGYFTNTVDFDPGPTSFTLTALSQDIYVSKLSASGNFLWAKKIGDIGNEFAYTITTDASNNILFTGKFQNTVDFDPGPGTFTLSAASEDIYLCKLDPAGNFLMAKSIGGSGSDIGYGIDVDASGNIIMSGVFSATADFDPGPALFNLTSAGSYDLFILKLNPSGNFTWVKTCGSTLIDGVSDVTTDAGGNIYAAGYFQNLIDFDPGPGTYTVNTVGAYDGFALKLTASGNFNWVFPIGSPNYDIVTCVAEDGSGNVYTGGYIQGYADFDPGPINYGFNIVGAQDAFIEKIGYCTTAPATPSSIVGTSLFCSGSASMSLNYSVAPVPGASIYSWTVPPGWSGSSTTNSLSVISGTSGVISVAVTNSCGTSVTQTLNIIIDTIPTLNVVSSSSLICAGHTVTLTANGASSYSWNPGSFSGNPVALNPTITTNYTITGVSASGCSNTSTITQNVSACTGIFQQQSKNIFKIYPNPTQGNIYIEALKPCKVILTTIMGQEIFCSETQEGINILSLPAERSGIYFLKIKDGNSEEVFKLIKDQ